MASQNEDNPFALTRESQLPSPAQREEERVKAHQTIRIRRFWMTLASYCFTSFIVCFSTLQGYLAPKYMVIYLLMAASINLFFYIVFRRGWNLNRKDPNLTAEQMVLSILPAVWTMYFVDNSLVRTSFLLLAVVPLLYGILGLNRQRLIWVGFISILLFVGLDVLLLINRPQVMDINAELVVLLTLQGMIVQIALIGGYISKLREKLRGKNDELNQALDKICQMANQDELTGIHNRRFLLQAIEQEFSRCQRGAQAFSLSILDIDHFKLINDAHGHLIGDEVLVRVAQEIKDSVRKIDCFGRYGGEEFLLILPQTPIEGAVLKLERIRQAVASLRFSDIREDLQVTISIGVAQYRNDESLRETLTRADYALYQAKESGRNKVQNAEVLTIPE